MPRPLEVGVGSPAGWSPAHHSRDMLGDGAQSSVDTDLQVFESIEKNLFHRAGGSASPRGEFPRRKRCLELLGENQDPLAVAARVQCRCAAQLEQELRRQAHVTAHACALVRDRDRGTPARSDPVVALEQRGIDATDEAAAIAAQLAELLIERLLARGQRALLLARRALRSPPRRCGRGRARRASPRCPPSPRGSSSRHPRSPRAPDRSRAAAPCRRRWSSPGTAGPRASSPALRGRRRWPRGGAAPARPPRPPPVRPRPRRALLALLYQRGARGRQAALLVFVLGDLHIDAGEFEQGFDALQHGAPRGAGAGRISSGPRMRSTFGSDGPTHHDRARGLQPAARARAGARGALRADRPALRRRGGRRRVGSARPILPGGGRPEAPVPDRVGLAARRGFRKMRAQNRAVLQRPSELLLFLDGDCLPYRNWVEVYRRHARPGEFLVGGYIFLATSRRGGSRPRPCARARTSACSTRTRGGGSTTRIGATSWAAAGAIARASAAATSAWRAICSSASTASTRRCAATARRTRSCATGCATRARAGSASGHARGSATSRGNCSRASRVRPLRRALRGELPAHRGADRTIVPRSGS